MEILQQPITRQDMRDKYLTFFSEMVKIVVDVEQRRLAICAELHADLELLLLESGSLQTHLWGANLYPDEPGLTMIDYQAMINIRPSQNNLRMEIMDPKIRECIQNIVCEWVRDAA
jgi:hypothetical protein